MVLDCNAYAQKILKDAMQDAAYYAETIQPNFNPTLAIIFIGNDTANREYLMNKIKIFQRVGIEATVYHLSSNHSKEQIIYFIRVLNEDVRTNAIIVQLPLPKSLRNDTFDIISSIDPTKDVSKFAYSRIEQLVSSGEWKDADVIDIAECKQPSANSPCDANEIPGSVSLLTAVLASQVVELAAIQIGL